MFADPYRYHSIYDIIDKPNITINYFWSMWGQTNYTELIDIEQPYDYIKYSNGQWFGITDKHCETAVYYNFNPFKVPFKEFIKLIDFKIHNLKSYNGKHKNLYTNIIIISMQNPSYLYLDENYSNLKIIKSWIHFFTVD